MFDVCILIYFAIYQKFAVTMHDIKQSRTDNKTYFQFTCKGEQDVAVENYLSKVICACLTHQH